ncbi:MAG: mechanosensitive ion channel [Clostridia bacterium]|nr:mechanosensitive ion channel [Clostridia bacterium]
MNQIILTLQRMPHVTELLGTLMVIFVIGVIRRVINRLLHSYIEDVQMYHKYRSITNKTCFTAIFVLLLLIWFKTGTSLGTFFGLLSAGIAIALKDLLANIAAWLFIIARKPFVIGDRIEIGNVAGDVVDSRIFQFTIMEIGNWVDADQSTGRIIHVPNHKVLTDNLANYSAGFEHIWNEIQVVITFESDRVKARALLEDVLNEHGEKYIQEVDQKLKKASKKYHILYKNLTPIIYTDVVDYGVKMTLRYLCKPRSRRTTVDNIWRDLLDRIDAEPSVELAYPTQRIVLPK